MNKIIEFDILKEKLNKLIIPNIDDKKIKKIIFLLSNINDNLSQFDSKFSIEDNNIYNFKIYFDFLTIICYKNNTSFERNFYPLQKLNKIKFINVSNILEYDNFYNILIIEKLKPLIEDNKVIDKYNNHTFFKKLIYVCMKVIFTLFIYNKQYSKKLSINCFGIDKNQVIKVFDLAQPIYLNPNDEEEVKIRLLESISNFLKRLIKMTKSIKIKKFFSNLKNDITNYKIIEIPTSSGAFKKQKIRMFKAIDVEGILNYILRQKL